MPKVYNMKTGGYPEDAVFIGRPTIYGNPFIIGRDGSRADVCRMYKRHVQEHPELVAEIKKNLKGKNLVCYCKPAMCHGDYLLEVANE